jgi:hypothetical protein
MAERSEPRTIRQDLNTTYGAYGALDVRPDMKRGAPHQHANTRASERCSDRHSGGGDDEYDGYQVHRWTSQSTRRYHWLSAETPQTCRRFPLDSQSR